MEKTHSLTGSRERFAGLGCLYFCSNKKWANYIFKDLPKKNLI